MKNCKTHLIYTGFAIKTSGGRLLLFQSLDENAIEVTSPPAWDMISSVS